MSHDPWDSEPDGLMTIEVDELVEHIASFAEGARERRLRRLVLALRGEIANERQKSAELDEERERLAKRTSELAGEVERARYALRAIADRNPEGLPWRPEHIDTVCTECKIDPAKWGDAPWPDVAHVCTECIYKVAREMREIARAALAR